MKLLVFTQIIDTEDPTLGFFTAWVREISKEVESVQVICLKKGSYNLPSNVSVYSLGKEIRPSRFNYIKNLYKILFSIRGSYDKVFVHMNQEYILLSGLYWKFAGIPVYMWRNHGSGSTLTHIAVFLCTKVFCTSKKSFTARFKKTKLMPVGVDTSIFKPILTVTRKPHSICMVGRISPLKSVDVALKAVSQLVNSGEEVYFATIGPVSEKDKEYYDGLQKYVLENNLSSLVSFVGPIAHDRLPEMFNSYEICINLSEPGMFDKTILESTACGAIPLVSNHSLKGSLPDSCIVDYVPENIAKKIKNMFDPKQKAEIKDQLKLFVDSNSLSTLVKRLKEELV